jgi:RHS repeat-associated protein
LVASGVDQWYEWDVSSYVMSERAAGRNVVSFALRVTSGGSGSVSFKSKENGIDQPRLYIELDNTFFSHVDHLNTPRLITDANQQVVWRWDQQEPFGDSPADENPSGLGVFEFDFRLPGQRRDKETGLHYSYFRDCYDAATGRFCQPDPAGSVMFRDMGFRSIGALGLTRPDLADLLDSDKPKYNHPYAYAKNNPLSYTDPLGLLPQPDVCSLQGCTFEFEFISPLNPAMTLCYYRCFGITGLVPYRPKMAWCPPNIPHPGGL